MGRYIPSLQGGEVSPQRGGGDGVLRGGGHPPALEGGLGQHALPELVMSALGGNFLVLISFGGEISLGLLCQLLLLGLYCQ